MMKELKSIQNVSIQHFNSISSSCGLTTGSRALFLILDPGIKSQDDSIRIGHLQVFKKNAEYLLQNQIKEIQTKLFELGNILPGSLSLQYNVCGNPSCTCKHPTDPRKHGPYTKLSYTWKGKTKNEFVKNEEITFKK